MKKRLIGYRLWALLVALVCLLGAVGCGEVTETEIETEDILTVETPEPPVAGLDTMAAIGSHTVNSDFAILCELDGLVAVAGLRAEERMYPASMTKLMTFIVAYEKAADHSALIQITKELKNQYRLEFHTVCLIRK